MADRDNKGRFLRLPEGANPPISSANARDMVQRRIEKKRARLVAGANAVIAEGGKFDGRGGDFVEAIGEALTITALNPDSSQQVKAAEFLFREAGISERQAVEAGGSPSLDGVASLVAELAAFASSIGGLLAQSGADGYAFDKSPYHNQQVTDGVLSADDGGAAGSLAVSPPVAAAVQVAGDGGGVAADRGASEDVIPGEGVKGSGEG